eukprot:jgi/Hompol1/6776/HPOL_000932-RA
MTAESDTPKIAVSKANDQTTPATTTATTIVANGDSPVVSDAVAEYALVRRRFLIAGAVCLGNLANSAIWTTFSAVTPASASFYGTSSFGINMLSLLFFAWFIPVSPIASWLIDTKGLRLSVLLGSWLTALGALVRFLGSLSGSTGTRFALAIVGNSLSAIGQPFLIDAPSEVTDLWFGEKERTTANTVMTLGQPIGSIISFIAAPALVGGDNNCMYLNLCIFLVSIACAVPSLWVTDRPPIPPAPSAKARTEPFLVGLKRLFTIPAYIILWIVFGVFLGIFSTFVTLLSDYATPYGYNSDQSGNLGIITIAVGLFTAGVVGPILDSTKAHEIAVKICCLVSTIGCVLLLLGMRPGQYTFLALGAALIGAGGFPLIPTVLEVAVEVTFPIAPSTSGGFLMWFGQVWSMGLLLGSNGLRSSVDSNLYNAVILLIVCAAFGLVASLFFKNANRRLKVDQDGHRTAPLTEVSEKF